MVDLFAEEVAPGDVEDGNGAVEWYAYIITAYISAPPLLFHCPGILTYLYVSGYKFVLSQDEGKTGRCNPVSEWFMATVSFGECSQFDGRLCGEE